MNNKTLYFLRHGQSVYNKMGIIQGDIDTPLSEEGKTETKKKAPLFKDFGFKFIARSPLARAKQTAEIINEHLNLPMETWENLKEMDFGDWDAGMKHENWDQYRIAFYEEGLPPPKGESRDGVLNRFQDSVLDICNEVDDHPILIVCHGMVMRILFGEWYTNKTFEQYKTFKMPNLALYKVDVKYDANNIKPGKYEFIDINNL